ncbi:MULTISPECIES: Ppx/GppA phosphatase family protein [Aphanizomenon]|jgi:exopolyphosphatase/guanosine-5'-triphosphate,3'-diphosphate pyrophosphatase|uniref:Ppx/GppA family phosphatase n=1 Tax=Aphanizomenon flos-aquae FACHB-1249 TaxID=2692889 RepID=A0ABR8IRQ5_APHFL|nr:MULTISPECIES: Ppx/GppA phosphatase family protein [Aphanizomenon]OBQ28242.1 MAG: exopolyphosphatase [Aphanizomenon flos-aquae MDT14a]MBD2391178.1 Ppx/GppA family phosphatase [Aphanizomenon flos-aquae FACHB-1171]MBD2556517.1 Ppx/GppA family phosphatase [Aphanizomenon flos-aquae FACHB-1290]MBD2632106.1 Ppx/GppA family phosphatase [Aphanizomenon sp. FACHB-1399]MBD2642901.1 Ppx/GppA family phosphatase [Aphanizomenon sp. FACHB-1401]
MLNLIPVDNRNPLNQPVRENQMIAAIDIGTNSLHMVIVKIEAALPSFTMIAREKETVRLGDRNLITGELKPEVMLKAIACLGRFKTLAHSLEVNSIVAVATSAVRESPNGKEFLHQIETELGLSVDLISGPEEARRIYLGVLSGMEFNHQPHIIIDIGGGSTELILGDSEEPRSLTSTKIGAVRLTGELVNSDPITETEFKYLQAYARGMLERSVEEVQEKLKIGEFPRLIGTSGTIETIATIHAREKLGLVPSTLNGYQFSLQDLRIWVTRLRKMTNVERATIPGMPEKRSEVILAGAVILQEAMTLLGVESLTVCERALREGIIVDWMLAHGFIDNRLRFQTSVRERSVLKTAKKYYSNLEHSERITAFALNIFDQTQGKLHYWNTDQRKLLWAAAILHNCGHYVSHSSHHKHSYYLIRNGELLGYNETEIEIIANIARYHRKSAPKKKHDNYRNLLHKEHRQMVNQLSAILRLAVALDRRRIGAISHVKCEYLPNFKEFKMFIFPSLIDDECALEMWSLDYKKGVFEEEFGLRFMAILMNR